MRPPRKLERKHGCVWEIRWRDGRCHRSRVFPLKRDAELFKAELWRTRRLGVLAGAAVAEHTLSEFSSWWWRVHVKANLQPTTRERYRQVIERYVLPHLGELQLHELTPAVVAEFRAKLAEQEVRDPTARKVLFVLQSMLRFAVLRGALHHNPVEPVPKPPRGRPHVVPPLPSEVEAIRSALGLQDATLVSLLAYAGLRPGEALALRWRAVATDSILVERSLVSGVERATKTKAARFVNLLRPLAEDLAAYRRALASARPSTLLFARPDGRPWSRDDYRNWRRRRFRPAAEAAGFDDLRPYDLRHFFVSLLANAGTPILDVAAQAGHSPEECMRSYCHLFGLHGRAAGSRGCLENAFRRGWRTAEDAVQAARRPLDSSSGR